MIEFLILVAGLVFGFFVGQVWLMIKIKNMILMGKLNQESPNIHEIHPVKQLFIERVGNILYLFDRNNKNFICQGSSMDELADLAKKYNHIEYAAVLDEHATDVVAFVDGKVETTILKKHES